MLRRAQPGTPPPHRAKRAPGTPGAVPHKPSRRSINAIGFGHHLFINLPGKQLAQPVSYGGIAANAITQPRIRMACNVSNETRNWVGIVLGHAFLYPLGKAPSALVIG